MWSRHSVSESIAMGSINLRVQLIGRVWSDGDRGGRSGAARSFDDSSGWLRVLGTCESACFLFGNSSVIMWFECLLHFDL